MVAIACITQHGNRGDGWLELIRWKTTPNTEWPFFD